MVFSFISILLIVVVSWVGAKIILPAEDDELLKLLTLLFFGALAFSVIISVRIYYHGLCLSAFEAREREAALVRKDWTEWASKSFMFPLINYFSLLQYRKPI